MGERGVIARLRDQAPEMLRYLAEKGLVVGAEIQMIKADPFDGPITLMVNSSQQVIGANVAHFILVSALEP